MKHKKTDQQLNSSLLLPLLPPQFVRRLKLESIASLLGTQCSRLGLGG